MARRRINRRLLLILVGGLIVLIGFGWGWWQGRLRQRDPLPYLERGDALFQQGHYQEAASQYSQANSWAGRKGNTATQAVALVKLSKVLPHLETEHAVFQALAALNQAVSKDPTSIDVRKELLELQYQLIRDSGSLEGWQNIKQYADNLAELDSHNARANYLAGLATLNVAEIRRESDSSILTSRQQALLYFQKACEYSPESVEYCRALAQMHLSIASLISWMRTPLPEGDRQLVIDHWYKANHVIRQFLILKPDSGAAMVLLAGVLDLPRDLANRDLRDRVAEQSAATKTLSDQELLEAYFEAFGQDSPRPALTGVIAAIDRLTYDYIQAAQKLNTDQLAVQLAVADYWFKPTRRDLGKVVIALQKAATLEQDVVTKLQYYLQIADICSQDAQRDRALKVCDEALDLAKSVDLKIVRASALRGTIYSLNIFAARTLLDLAGQVRGTDSNSDEQVNTLLARADRHLEDAQAIIEVRTIGYGTLIIRGKIAEIRRPRSRENLREAIRLYEQARDMMESGGLRGQPRYILEYVNLQASLALAYGFDGQPGAAEDTLTKGFETIRQFSPASPPPVNPAVMLYLIDLQLDNAHVEKAEQSITDLITQLSAGTSLSEQENTALLAEALNRRVRQYQLQDKTEEALQTARYIEQHFANNAIWAISKQIQILDRKSAPQAEMEVLLKRWIELSSDSPVPLALLAELYLQYDQREKAVKLLDDAVTQHPQLQEFLSQIRQMVAEPDPQKRREIQERRIQDIADPLQRQLSWYQLYRANYSYYSRQATNYKQEGKLELAQKAQEQALQTSDLALQALQRAYEIQPDQPGIYEPLLAYYLTRSDWQEAQKLVDRAKEKNWDGVGGLYFLGRLYNAKGGALRAKGEAAAEQEFQQALKSLEQAVRDRQTFYQAWAEKSRAETNLSLYDAALQSASKAVQLNPNNILTIQALLEVTAVNWRKAAAADDLVIAENAAKQVYQLAQRVLTLQPENEWAKQFRLAYFDNYAYDEALKERLAMLKEDPSNRENLQGIIRIYQLQHQTAQLEQLLVSLVDQQPDSFDLIILLSRFYIQEKQYDRALQRLLPARQRWPDRLELAALLAETYRLIDQPQDAIACMQQFLATTTEGERWLAYRALGVLYGQLGNQDKAVEAFRQAVSSVRKNQPQNYRAICDLAQMIFPNAQQEALDIVLPLAEKDNQDTIQTLVRLYGNRGQREEAVKWAQKGVALAPESTDSKITLAGALLDADKPNQAQQILEATIKQLQGNSQALALPYTMLADAYSLQKQYDTAIRVLEEAVAAGVNYPRVRFALAGYYRFQGKFEEASHQYRLVLERYAGNVEARSELAKSLIRQESFSQAADVLEEGRSVQPKEYRWPQQLLALWLNRKDQPFKERYSKALQFALEANTKSGNEPDTVVEIMAVLNIGGEYQRCVDFYQSDVPEKYKDDYRILLGLARAQIGRWRRGKFPPPGTPPMNNTELERLKNQAVSLLYQVLDNSGDDMQASAEAMNGLEALLGLDTVIESAQASLNNNSQDPRSRIFLVSLLNRRGWQRLRNNQPELVKADMNQAIELLQALITGPEVSVVIKRRAYGQLAQAYTSLQEYEQAKEAYLSLLKVWPNNVQALNNVAYILSDVLNRPQEALGYIEVALWQNPQEANLLDTYGWTLFKAGQRDRAILELRRSVAIRPSGMNYYHLGVVLKEVGERRLALSALREAAKLLENDPIGERDIGEQLRMLIAELEKE